VSLLSAVTDLDLFLIKMSINACNLYFFYMDSLMVALLRYTIDPRFIS